MDSLTVMPSNTAPSDNSGSKNSGNKNRSEKDSSIPKHPASLKLPVPLLRQISVIVTAGQLIAVTIAFFGSDGVRNIVAIACSAVFVAGALLFAWALTIAAGRSRMEELTVGGAFFLAGSIEKPDRRWAYGYLTAQTLIGFAGAVADPYTTMAFGVLVPMFGLGVIAFLGSAHGAFRQRKPTK